MQRLLGPGAMSATALSKESGISQQTLSRWLREASTVPKMGDKVPDNDSRRPRRNAEDKLRIVMAASQLSEADLGDFLRREGLHSAQLEEWRKLALAAAQQALSGGKSSSKATSETQRIRELERDLDRKNRALAEVTALLALQKKVHAIWGDADESTPPKNAT